MGPVPRKRALVLSGGGAKGQYHVGVLELLTERKLANFDLLAGTSVGALAAAALAQHPRGREGAAMASLMEAFDVQTSDIWKPWPIVGVAAGLWRGSLYDSAPLLARVRRLLRIKALRSSGRSLRVVAVSLRTGEARTFTEQDPEIVEAVAASAAFPVFFQPVQLGGEWFTDGGLREVTPLGCAVREGATEVVVSTCQAIAGHGAGSGKPSTVVLARLALELLLDEVVRGDLRVCALRNELALAGVPGHKLVKVTAIRPSLDPVANSLVFHPDEAASARELGYRDAIVAVDT